MLFARDMSRPLSSLLKQFDDAVGKNKDADLRSFAVFLSDDAETMEKTLKSVAEKEKITENVPLTIVEEIAGPAAFKIHKDAEVTVLLYTKGKVVSNFAFKAGELQEKHVKAIVGDIPKILPSEEELQRARKLAEEIEKEKAKKDKK
jgi:hypothetical protein